MEKLTLSKEERRALSTVLTQSGRDPLFVCAGVKSVSIYTLEAKPLQIFAAMSLGNTVVACTSIPADHSNDTWRTISDVSSDTFANGNELAETVRIFARDKAIENSPTRWLEIQE